MKFITVNEPHKASISSFDNVFMAFVVGGELGFRFSKDKSEKSNVGLDLWG